METVGPCRTCLAKKAQKNVFDLRHKKSNSTWSEIMLFCLDIKVTDDNSKESTKLCIKCYRKILLFYKFKLQAQKNDSILKKTKVEPEVKHEVFLSHEVKNEEGSNDNFECFANEGLAISEVKIELEDDKDGCPSDDELLSVIRNIKYEYVPEENLEETKENEPIRKRKSRKKVYKSTITNKKQICEECGKSVVNLREHMQLHMPPDKRKRFPCKVCDRIFATYAARYRHTKIKHLGIKPHCNICNKAVVNLRAHTLIVHETSQLRFACASCDRRFISQSSLDAHTPVHSSERAFPCEQCDKKFQTKITMLQHVRQVHNEEKSHMCQYCSKSFFKKCHLQIHLRSHTKEKPYECKECGKFFTSNTVLKNHRFLHSGTKVFNCQFCDMTFASPQYVRTHMLIHTKEKKYPCKYCGVKFGRSDHRKRHEFTAHEKHMISSM